MKDTKDVIACVVDHQIFLPWAQRLAREFKKVYYHTPVEKAFPKLADSIIGDGFSDIVRCDDPFDVMDEVDLWIFPDIGFSGLQLHLEKLGKPVWGSRSADSLEIHREKFLDMLKAVGLSVPPHTRVRGVGAMAEFLKDKEDKWVKMSKYRGDFETFHWRNAKQDSGWPDFLRVKFGPLANEIPFVIADTIETEIEDGYDGYNVDGLFPKLAVHGIECKDRGYLCAVQDYDSLPEQVKAVNAAVAPVLRERRYRNKFSTEIRITEDDAYFIDTTCFSDDTEVLTESGWKLFSDIIQSDKVATLDVQTKKIRYEQPLNYHCYDHDGEMILISNRKKTIECLVTPNHRVLRTDRNGKRLFFEQASKLTDKGFIPRTGIWVGKSPEIFEIPAYYKSWVGGRWGKCFREKDCPPMKCDIVTMLKFMGYYLSEGSTGGSGELGSVVNIAQSKYFNEMFTALQQFPVNPRKTSSGFQFCSVQLSSYCSQFGLCSEKFVPQWIKNLSPDLINIFLDAYTLGDGSIEGNGSRTIITTSRQMADDLQELFLKCGSCATIVKKATAGTIAKFPNSEYVRNHDMYLIYENSDHNQFWFETQARKNNYIKTEKYIGKVYCLTVPNGTLYVRRNGKPFWSGNCRNGSPPSQCEAELFSNWGDIVWHGAHGELVEPISVFKYGVQTVLNLKREATTWASVPFPDELRQWVKCGNCCEYDGQLVFPPQDEPDPMIGWLVAGGDTLDEAIETLKERVEELPDGVTTDINSLVELVGEMNEAAKLDIHYGEGEIPDGKAIVEA